MMTSNNPDPRWRYVTHVSLTSGDACQSYRAQVCDAELETARRLLFTALSRPQSHIDVATTGCTMVAEGADNALAVVVWGLPADCHGQPPRPLVTFGVATDTE